MCKTNYHGWKACELSLHLFLLFCFFYFCIPSPIVMCSEGKERPPKGIFLCQNLDASSHKEILAQSQGVCLSV